MKILHTSDWHLGAKLHGQSRAEESAAFLQWLRGVICENAIDALIVSGDIFDGSTPGSGVQSMYFGFLASLQDTCCKSVVIVAGNHDSPSQLAATGEILKHLNIHVVGAATDDPGDEIIVLRDRDGAALMVVAAVPYLRESDIRCPEAGEDAETVRDRVAIGIAEHYRDVCGRAETVRAGLSGGGHVPLVVTGHLYVSGYSVSSSERRMYIGSLGAVDAAIFPERADYVALGHLHKAQHLGDRRHFRYSGSPLQLGFDDAGQNKFVYVAEFAAGVDRPPEVRHIQVPVWQRLDRVRGKSWDEIRDALQILLDAGESVWADVHYDGETMAENLSGRVHDLVDGSDVLVLGVYDLQHRESAMMSGGVDESLQDLDPHEVFRRRLELAAAPAEKREELEKMFDEILFEIQNRDGAAEADQV